MHFQRHKTTSKVRAYGFTIVEVLVVIAIVGIIAAISTVGYGSWQQQIAKKEVTSDLQLAMTAMENAKNFGNGYPTALPSSFKESSSVERPTIQWGDGTRYCMQTNSKEFPTLRFYVDSTQGDQVRTGVCPASPIAPPPPPPTPPAAPAPGSTPTSSSTISVAWSAVATATSYTVRYGTGTPTTVACTSSATSCVINGLTANTVYNVSVVATNAYGSSPAGTSSATTQIPAPANPGIAFTGPSYIKGSDGFFYYRYNVTSSGGACSIGLTEWKIGISPNPPTTSTWSSLSWQSTNTRTIDVSANGIYSPTDVYIFAKPRCVSGSNTQEGSTAATTYGSPNGI